MNQSARGPGLSRRRCRCGVALARATWPGALEDFKDAQQSNVHLRVALSSASAISRVPRPRGGRMHQQPKWRWRRRGSGRRCWVGERFGLAESRENSMKRSHHSRKLTLVALTILVASCSSNNAQNGGSGGSRPSAGGASGGATTATGGQVGTGGSAPGVGGKGAGGTASGGAAGSASGGSGSGGATSGTGGSSSGATGGSSTATGT